MVLPDIDIVARNAAEHLFCHGKGTYDHVVSISNADAKPPRGFPSYPARSIALFFDDYVQTLDAAPKFGIEPPAPKHVEAIIRFARDINPGDTVLCHCNAGISRSSAAAVIIMASKLPPSAQSAQRVIRKVLQIRQICFPNVHMIRYADQMLGYGGNLVAAREATFEGDLNPGFIIGLSNEDEE